MSIDEQNNVNGNEEASTQGTYSYKKEEINQGESVYQWSPVPDEPPVKQKKEKGFGKKVIKAIVLALIFGVIFAGAFAGVNYGIDVIKDKLQSDQKVEEQQDEKQSFIEDGKSEKNEKEKPEKKKEEKKHNVESTETGGVVTEDVSELVTNVMPAIVQVTNNGVAEYQSFFGTYQQETTSCGSGIIISQDDKNLYIATNNHVVEGSKQITITFSDDQDVDGEIKGTDSACDLAVVSVPIKSIPKKTISTIKVATIGDSDKVMVGNGCVVIGNAMGYGLSVTTGVISAKERETAFQDDRGNIIENTLIQTDAAVNPGNSGGAMLNADGEVIGIVSAKLSSEAVEGMGYAIPISYASSIINQMVDNDVVSELEASYLGIGGKDVTKEIAEENQVPEGVYVAKVVEGSGADKAGIKEGDIIVSFNGRKVKSMNTIQNILQYVSAGTTVEIVVYTEASGYEKEATYQVELTHKFTEIK